MTYPKIRLYEGCLPYVRPEANKVDLTPPVDGWRAPDQPEIVRFNATPPTRNWELENLNWGLQTVIVPMLQQLIDNGANGGITVSDNIQYNGDLTGLTCAPFTFVGSTNSEGGATLIPFEVPKKGASFNFQARPYFVAHPAPEALQNWFYQKKLKLALFKSDRAYTYGGNITGGTLPFAVIDLDYQILDGATNGGYLVANLPQPLQYQLDDAAVTIYAGLITVGAIAGTPPSLLEFRYSLGITQ